MLLVRGRPEDAPDIEWPDKSLDRLKLTFGCKKKAACPERFAAKKIYGHYGIFIVSMVEPTAYDRNHCIRGR